MGYVYFYAGLTLLIIALMSCGILAVRLKRLAEMVTRLGGQASHIRRDMQEAQKYAETQSHDTVTMLRSLDEHICGLEERILRLEQGAVPNYEAARKAKDEVDAFNIGIANILGYSQKEALRRREDSD